MPLGISDIPPVTRDTFRFVKEQGLPAFMALCLLGLLGWAVFVWNNVFSNQVAVMQRQSDILAQMHEDHSKLEEAGVKIVENQSRIIQLMQQAADQERNSSESRDRQNEILRRLEEKTR